MAIKCKGRLFGRKQSGLLFIGIGKPTFSTQGPPLPDRPPLDTIQPVGLRQVELTGTIAQLLTVEGDQRHRWLVLDDVPPEGAPARAVVRLRRRRAEAVNIDGAWQNVWTISNTSSLVLGSVFLVLGLLLLGWPWLRWFRRPSTPWVAW